MKSKRSIANFLVMFLLSIGFVVLSNQEVKADGTFCQTDRNACYAACDLQFAFNVMSFAFVDAVLEYDRCNAVCNAKELGCLANVAWDDWLLFINLNIGDNFQILNEPSPYCANQGDVFVNCGVYGTAVEVEACILMAQQQQAHFNCPQ